MTLDFHEKMMREAILEAQKGVGLTRPNPPVGAVVVDASGAILGRGYHHKAGMPHAEVEAIRACGDRDLSGATLYVTLEPCSTTGRTPPCTDLILQRKIGKVVIGTCDPNCVNSHKAEAILSEAGVDVLCGICEDEARELIRPFASSKILRRPFVTLKLALSLDGCIADRRGVSRWISGDVARDFVQNMRDTMDAILVGSGTVIADNPELVPHKSGSKAMPYRVVVDSSGRVPPSSKVLTDEFRERTIIFSAPKNVNGHVDLGVALSRLTLEYGVMNLLCEGGGELAGALMRARLVDRLVLIYAPVIIGDFVARRSFVGVDALLEDAHLDVPAPSVMAAGVDTILTFNLQDPLLRQQQ